MNQRSISIVGSLLIVFSLFSCKVKESPMCLLLPSGEILTGENIKNLSEKHPLYYKNYQGFTGALKDTVLNKFVVLMENQASKVGRDIASEAYINKLKYEKLIGLRFDKIPDTKMSYEEVLLYISEVYPDLKRINDRDKQETEINRKVNYMKEGKCIMKVEHFEIGVPGTFVNLFSYHCVEE